MRAPCPHWTTFSRSRANLSGPSLYRRIAIAFCRFAISNIRERSLYKKVRAQVYTFDIHADNLNTVACPAFDNILKEQCDAVWPRTCPSEGASMCICKPFGRPASVHPKTIFRLDLSKKCVQFFLTFRWAVIVYHALLAALQTFFKLRESAHCVKTGNLGDEQHLMLEECPLLQGIRDNAMAYLETMPPQWFNSCGLAQSLL